MERMYYEAYDDRYRQIHQENLRWFAQTPSHIVMDVMREFHIMETDKVLEIGCGEGRDAGFLLDRGFDLLATDVSEAAISFCRKRWPEYLGKFRILDCVRDGLKMKFAFIYAVAVVHMLVRDEDRHCFYQFIYKHLKENGTALICTMGDGEMECCSNIAEAFALQERIHEASGRTVQIAGTSYRAVSFETFDRELRDNGLEIMKQGITDVEPDYWKMMYSVVRKA